MHLPIKPSAMQRGNILQCRPIGQSDVSMQQYRADAKVARVVKRNRDTRVKKLGFILILVDCQFFVE